MHGDFSRLRFDPLDRFSAVVALQGRVSMEADLNEHTAIVQNYLHTLVRDLLGKYAWTDPDSFKVSLVVDNQEITDVEVAPGHCYVDGLLVQNDGIGGSTGLYSQPDAYFDQGSIGLDAPFLVYLEVWERLVTAVEEPKIRDVALGTNGPDSSARTKVVWQLRVWPIDGGGPASTKSDALAYWSATVEPKLLGTEPARGTMLARVRPSQDDTLCALFPDAGYSGLENQLYRVEVHGGGVLGAGASEDPPTFVWSRDNGSVVFPILDRAAEVLTLSSLGRDDRYALAPGQWVELVDDATALNGERGELRRVLHVDPVGLRVTLDTDPPESTGRDPARHPFLRRWDQEPTHNLIATDNAIALRAGWFQLEDGLEVSFGDGTYLPGDYWVFAARVETGDIDWHPASSFRPPDGIERRFVPLAYVSAATADPVDLRASDTTTATTPAPQADRVLTLAPAFVAVGPNGWDLSPTVAGKELGKDQASGFMVVDLPHGSTVKKLRVTGLRTGAGGALTVALQRATFEPDALPETVAFVSVAHVPAGDPAHFDTPKDVAASPLSLVDTQTHKYFLIAQISGAAGVRAEVSAVQITYTPA